MVNIKKHKNIIIVLVLIISLCAIGVNLILRSKMVGISLLDSMYSYSPTKIKEQDAKLKEILSDNMYNVYTIGSDQRQVRMYLKMNNKECTPVIIHEERGRIVFFLESDSISSDRTFSINYKVGRGNKITSISEEEIFFLPPSDRSFYNK